MNDVKEGIERIGELILWRYPQIMTEEKRRDWMKAVWPKVLDRTPNGSTAFWRELYGRKFGLHGQWNDTAAPGK